MAIGVSFPGMVSVPGLTATVRAAQVVGAGGFNPTPTPTPSLTALTLAAAAIAENTASGAVISGILGKTAGSTLSLTSDAGGRFALSGTSLVAGLTSTDYETATSHQVTIRETLAGAIGSPRDTTLTINVTNVFEKANLSALGLSSTSLTIGTTASGSITGTTAGSTITATGLPTGLTINGAARTWSYDGTGSAGTASVQLTETLGDSANSPRVSGVSVTVAAAGPAANTAEFYMGLQDLRYYNGAQPMIDRIKQADLGLKSGQFSGAVDMTTANTTFDANGKPTKLAAPYNRIKFIIPGAYYRQANAPNRFVVLHNMGTVEAEINMSVVSAGSGRTVIQHNAAGTDRDWFEFTLAGFTPDQTFNLDIKVIREDHETAFNAGEIFNPDWLTYMQKFDGFRFMDWTRTNVNETTTLDEHRRAAAFTYVNRVPFEICVALCNRLGKGGHFCVPHKFTDAAVTELATMLRDTMTGKVTAELSNEVWNFSLGPQATYFNEQAQATNSAGATSGWTNIEMYNRRAAQVAYIFDQVFRAGGKATRRRLRNGLGMLTASPNMSGRSAGALWQGAKFGPAAALAASPLTAFNQAFDQFLLATYFSGQVAGTNDSDRTTFDGWVTSNDTTKAWQQIRTGGLFTNNDETQQKMEALLQNTWQPILDQYSVRGATYETSFGYLVLNRTPGFYPNYPTGSTAERDALAFLDNLQLMPLARTVNRDKYVAETGLGIDTHGLFLDCANPSVGQGGFFGTKKYTTQADTPRLLGYLDAKAEVPVKRANARPLTLTTNNPTGAVGGKAQRSFAPDGGCPPYFLRVASGAMAPGRTLGFFAETGTFTTESTAGYDYVVEVEDSSPTPQTATVAINQKVAAGGSFNPATDLTFASTDRWYDPSDLSTLFSNTAGTTAAVVDGPVKRMNAKSGGGKFRTSTGSTDPILRKAGSLYYLEWASTCRMEEVGYAGAAGMNHFAAMAKTGGGVQFVPFHEQVGGAFWMVATVSSSGGPTNNAGTPSYRSNGTVLPSATRGDLYTAQAVNQARVIEAADLNLAALTSATLTFGGYAGFLYVGYYFGDVLITKAQADTGMKRADLTRWLAAKMGLDL